MLRTCAVRLDAIEFTDSVRSFHTPETSLTCAWPPSLPSVPTSRATRVTSEVNTESCLIIVLTMFADSRNSPLSGRPSTSVRTVLIRSPCATAATARVTSLVGQRRSSIRVLTEDSISLQAPLGRLNLTRWRVWPSRPTTSPTRSSSRDMRSLAATMSLKVSAILPAMPWWSADMRTEKSPERMAWRAESSSISSEEPLAPSLVPLRCFKAAPSLANAAAMAAGTSLLFPCLDSRAGIYPSWLIGRDRSGRSDRPTYDGGAVLGVWAQGLTRPVRVAWPDIPPDSEHADPKTPERYFGS